jgi:hypothetical protein
MKKAYRRKITYGKSTQEKHFLIRTWIHSVKISLLKTSIQVVQMILYLWEVDCVWNVMAQAQKPDFVFRWNGLVHLNRRGCQFIRLLAAEVCASGVVMLDTPCSEVVWRVLATHSIRQFPIHFSSCASPCAITFQLDSTAKTLTK